MRDILGCSVIETTIDDLADVASSFRRQIPTTPATTKIKVLNAKLDTLTEQSEKAAQEIARIEQERETTERQIGDIEEKLRNSSAAKELQRSRDRLTEQLARVARTRRRLGRRRLSVARRERQVRGVEGDHRAGLRIS